MGALRTAAAAALALAALVFAGSALAAPVTGTIYYTTFSGGVNVHKVDYAYNPGVSFTLSNNVGIAGVPGADGIVFAPDGDLLIGGQGPYVNKIHPSGSGFQQVYTGGPAAFHLGLDPSGNYVWAGGIPGGLARVPLAPFATGTNVPLVGAPGGVDSIVFDASGNAYYTSSGPSGNGYFGRIDLSTAPGHATLSIIGIYLAAHGAAYDPYTGGFLLFGSSHVTQVTAAGAIVSDLVVPGMTFDQGAVDGHGHVLVASNSGHMLFVDYSASHLINAPGNFQSLQFLAPSLDDVTPLSGLGALPRVDLTLTKTAPPTAYDGGTLTYTLSVSNAGPDDATGVTVTDPLPAGATFASSADGCTASGSTVTCPLGAVAAGGSASASFVVSVSKPGGGTLTNTASVAADEGDSHLADNAATATTTILTQQPTSLAYDGDTTADYRDPATLSATLTSTETGLPVANESVTLTMGSTSCSGLTDPAGHASCSVVVSDPAGSYPVTASFAGDSSWLASSATGSFDVTREETTLTAGVAGPVANGAAVTLTGTLLEDGATPIVGRTVTLTLGSQSCTGVTDAGGVASCTVTVVQPLGPGTAAADFAGDGYYRAASDANDVVVYAFAPGGGAFVVGDGSAAGAVVFWGAQWSKANALSGGAAPASFKGYASAPAAPACGVAWSAATGSSAPPPAGPLPSYMAVIVASSATQSGSTISGATAHVVVVRTVAGYDANPGHAGTGAVVATIC